MLSTFVSTQRQTSRLRPKTGSQVGFELVRRRAVLIVVNQQKLDGSGPERITVMESQR